MYVREYLQFMGGLHKLGRSLRRRIDEVIEATGITVEQHKKIGQLSKGYRQRVGLAQALLHEPSTLILDEPTTGLDPNQIIEIRKLISELARERIILFSTHIMQEVEAVCTRILIVNQGKIAADTPVSREGDNRSVEEFFYILTKK
jgi:ABC-2 type transport system ATP-binding protein